MQRFWSDPSKCEFGVNHPTFLGHFVTAQGIELLLIKFEAIQQFPQPNTPHKLRKFLGLINFYHLLFHTVQTLSDHFTLYWPLPRPNNH